MSSPPVAPFQTSGPKYRDVDRLTNSAGICSVISQRSRDGSFTFAVFRVYNKIGEDGRTVIEEKTSFFPADMADSYIEHIRLTKERIEQLRQSPQALPFEIRRTEGHR